MEANSRNFDFKSDFDFPSLDKVTPVSSKRPTSPPEQATGYDSSKENRENSRSMSRGRGGKKKNWKTLQVEFANNNSHGTRFMQRGNGRNRFVGNPKPNEDSIRARSMDEGSENGFRLNRNGGRSRSRRARGGMQHTCHSNHGDEAPTNSHSPTSTLPPNPTIMTIPYTPNYATYVQPIMTNTTEPEPIDLMLAIRHQIEYYFSEENLQKDYVMRQNMTKDGFLPICFIASFKKLKMLTDDLETVINAMEESDKLEVIDRKHVRPIINPLRWPYKTGSEEEEELVPNTLMHPQLRIDASEFYPTPLVTDSSAELLTDIMGNLALDTESYDDYEQYYPNNVQDVSSSYQQPMFAYVSS